MSQSRAFPKRSRSISKSSDEGQCILVLPNWKWIVWQTTSTDPLTISEASERERDMEDPLFIRDDWRWTEDKPMCYMVKAGDFLWLTGQVALDENSEIVGPGDIQLQTRQVFTNIRRILALAGCDLTSVIRLTNYFTTSMTDMVATRKYWEVRREFFGNHRPASTGVKVAALMLPELMIEVDAIAYAPNAVISPEATILNPQA
jgi:2-iminobutanoate/2-iminopropanoate deaminase